MRKLIIGAITIGTAGILAGASTAPGPGPGPGTTGVPPVGSIVPMTVEALEVGYAPRLASGAPRLIRGHFTIRPAVPGDKQSITRATTGGACVLTQFQGVDKACQSDSQCHYAGPEILPTLPPTRKRWWGYCLRKQDSLNGDLASNRCWVRPDPGYCRKGVSAGTYYTPSVDPAVVYKEAAKYAKKPVVKWMTYGCLNGPYDLSKPTETGCGGYPYPKMHHQGKIWTVP